MHSVLLARWTNGPRMHRVLRRTASALEIGKGRVPNFCHDFGKASELTQNAQRVASALCVYRACAPRMSGAGLARSTHVWRAFGVYIHASSSAHTFEHAQKIPTHTANDDECIALVQRWSSALDERVTSDDARLANDNALAKIGNFPCVGRASHMRPLCVTGPLHTIIISNGQGSKSCTLSPCLK